MHMSPDHRRALSHAMRRRAALTLHLDPTTGRRHTTCHWARRGLCDYTTRGAR